MATTEKEYPKDKGSEHILKQHIYVCKDRESHSISLIIKH